MKTKPFLIALISFCAVLALAENQKGYVKTKGRLNKNGTVIAGSKLSGVSIIIKNQNAIISNKDGGFSFRVTGQSYELDSVTKNNYVLADPDILFKSYSYSKNPLVLVMEDKKQQENDRKDLERKVTRNLYALIDKKNEEIESLKEQKKISDEEYDKLRQKINKEQDDNVSIIKRMVDEYMKIDFDREDDIDKEIANHILNGELTKADSVICTMGDFEQLEQELKRIHDANATGRKALEKSMAVENNKRNRLARNYYSKSQIALLRHQNDSVAYYLERRARLDSTNIRWLLDAGEFIHEFTADYVKAKEFYDRALEESSKQQNDYFTAESYNNIANLYHLQGNNKEALSFYEKAITLMQQVRGNDCWEVARYYGNIGSVNTSLKDLQKALDYNRKALDIYQNSADDKIKDIDKARGYNNIGQSEIELGHYDEGEGYLKKGLEIASKLSGNDRGVLFELYNNLGNYYYIMRKLTPAGECFDSARVVAETIYGPYNPKTALVTMNLGVLYTNTGDFEKGYDYILKGVNIHKNLTGENNTTVMTGYSSLAILCGDYLNPHCKRNCA